MLLPGRLSASTLGDLLGALHRSGTTGRLELSEMSGPPGDTAPGRRHVIHLADGLVTAVETTLRVPLLGEILRREKLVPHDAITRLIGKLDAGDRRHSGEILVASGLARADAVQAGLRAQIRARLDALFTIREAAITFHTARPAGGTDAPIKPFAPPEFLHGRPRRKARADRSEVTPRPQAARPRPAREDETPPQSHVRTIRDDARVHARRLLGVADDAAPADVRRAFRKLASSLHPDRQSRETQRAGADFAQLSAAYHLLVA